jgi:DtxR family Mn-dependent transcriptional regulator
MNLSESAQELLEQLWIATEEESEAGLETNASPLESADELVGLGLVVWSGEQLTLTASGRPEAAQAVRRHRLAERLLIDVLTAEEIAIDEHACRFEHALVHGMGESICTLLGHPRLMVNPRRLQKLMAMGVLPGVSISLLRRFPSFVFEAGYSQFAVDEDIAADIYVRLSQG